MGCVRSSFIESDSGLVFSANHDQLATAIRCIAQPLASTRGHTHALPCGCAVLCCAGNRLRRDAELALGDTSELEGNRFAADASFGALTDSCLLAVRPSRFRSATDSVLHNAAKAASGSLSHAQALCRTFSSARFAASWIQTSTVICLVRGCALLLWRRRQQRWRRRVWSGVMVLVCECAGRWCVQLQSALEAPSTAPCSMSFVVVLSSV